MVGGMELEQLSSAGSAGRLLFRATKPAMTRVESIFDVGYS